METEFQMTNEELRQAIIDTANQMRRPVMAAPLPESAQQALARHLEALLEIERARAGAVVAKGGAA